MQKKKLTFNLGGSTNREPIDTQSFFRLGCGLQVSATPIHSSMTEVLLLQQNLSLNLSESFLASLQSRTVCSSESRDSFCLWKGALLWTGEFQDFYGGQVVAGKRFEKLKELFHQFSELQMCLLDRFQVSIFTSHHHHHHYYYSHSFYYCFHFSFLLC